MLGNVCFLLHSLNYKYSCQFINTFLYGYLAFDESLNEGEIISSALENSGNLNETSEACSNSLLQSYLQPGKLLCGSTNTGLLYAY